MNTEVVTRLRNAVAAVVAAWLEHPSSRSIAVPSALPFSSMTESDWRRAVTLWRAEAADLLARVSARPCPACGADASRFLFLSYDAHPFHECHECGCWFEPRIVDTALFDRFFERCTDGRVLAMQMMESRDAEQGREADMARVGGYLDDLADLLGDCEGAAYLDVGCGVGHSLRAAADRGWRVQGVEADEGALTISRAAGLPVVPPGEPLLHAPYRVISFWETLEHIADPLGVLSGTVQHLDDGGIVAVTVPNLNALATRTLREACAWVHGGYNTPGHINLFHPGSLARLFERAGLELVDVSGCYSANPVELAAYLGGESRGAFDVLEEGSPGRLPADLVQVLTDVWPGLGLLEEVAGASPILFAIGCRRGDAARLGPALEARRQRRREAVMTRALAQVATEPDYKEMAAHLQAEVDRRDDLLRAGEEAHGREIARREEAGRERDAALQGEVDRRDALLRSTVEGMQAEVDRRDQLLQETRSRYDRSLSGRVGAAMGAIRRRLRLGGRTS